jgi:hypothetical protein
MTKFKSFFNQPEMAGLPSGQLEWLKLRTSEPLGPAGRPSGALLLEPGVTINDTARYNGASGGLGSSIRP